VDGRGRRTISPAGRWRTGARDKLAILRHKARCPGWRRSVRAAARMRETRSLARISARRSHEVPLARSLLRVDAIVVAAVGFAGVAISLLAGGYFDRKRLFAEQLAIAFDRFKESQRRSAGIASLTGLKNSSPKLWAKHEGAVQSFLHAQALYLLSHGSNRWSAHEIANLHAILKWILPDTSTPPPTPRFRAPKQGVSLSTWQLGALKEAMGHYVEKSREADVTSPPRPPAPPSGQSAGGSTFAIESFRDELERIFIPRAAK
jgi:hypothetical protein